MFGDVEQKRAHQTQFLLEEPGRVVGLIGLQGVAADDLGEQVGPVDGRRRDRPHFIQPNSNAPPRGLPSGLGTGQSAADYGNFLAIHTTIISTGFRPARHSRFEKSSRLLQRSMSAK